MFKRALAFLALFSSLGTLVCCAIPAALVALGLGASLVSFLGNYPQLIWISEHKNGVFVFAGCMLAGSWAARRYSRDLSCPIGGETGEACATTRRASGILFYISVAVYLTGAFFAFGAKYLLE